MTTTVLRSTEPSSAIQYVMIPLSGRLLKPSSTAENAPRLTAQCTLTPDQKLHFELLMDLGDVTTLQYFPPWHPTPGSVYAPRLEQVPVTMEFLGYTKVKPVRRSWARMDQLHQELIYATPGLSSSNMEPITFYLQYLRALPTLHLTFANGRTEPVTVEFLTGPWQEQIRKESLCRASGL